jgi:riboflavin synthase alpha subunit
MFTGLVRETGTIIAAKRRTGVSEFEILAPGLAPDLPVGDSLAVNGACLTVTSRRADRVSVDVSDETRRVTTAALWRPGGRVHLEPALRASDRLGGHLVLGHVDGVGAVRQVRVIGGIRQITIEPPAGLLTLLLPKGSIAADGVSLTLDAGPFTRTFTLTVIPETLRKTELGAWRPGRRVNIEVDTLAKAAARQAQSASPPSARPLTLDDVLARGWS